VIYGDAVGYMGMRIRTSASSASSTFNTTIRYAGINFRYSQINDAPVVTNALFNNQENIVVPAGFSSEYIYVTADVYDAQGCSTILTPTGCAYRSGSSYSSCLESRNNENEVLSCEVLNCSGAGDNTANISCIVNNY